MRASRTVALRVPPAKKAPVAFRLADLVERPGNRVVRLAREDSGLAVQDNPAE